MASSQSPSLSAMSMGFKSRRRDLLQLSKSKLVKKCVKRGLCASGSKGDLVKRLINHKSSKSNKSSSLKKKSHNKSLSNLLNIDQHFVDNTNSMIPSFKLKHEQRMKEIKLKRQKQQKIKRKRKKTSPYHPPISLNQSITTKYNKNDVLLDENLNLVNLCNLTPWLEPQNCHNHKYKKSKSKKQKNTQKRPLSTNYILNKSFFNEQQINKYDEVKKVSKHKKSKNKKSKSKNKRNCRIKRKESIQEKRRREYREKTKNQTLSMYDSTKLKINKLRDRNDSLNGLPLPHSPIKHKKNKFKNLNVNKNKQEIDLEAYFGQLFSGLSQ